MTSRQIKLTILKNEPQFVAEIVKVDTTDTISGLHFRAYTEDINFSDKLRKAAIRTIHPQLSIDLSLPIGEVNVGTVKPKEIIAKEAQWKAIFEYLEWKLEADDKPIIPTKTASDTDEDTEEDDKTECEECGEKFDEDDIHYTKEAKNVCTDCLDTDYRLCKHCEEFFHEDNGIVLDDGSSDAYCNDCKYDYAFHCDDCENWYSQDSSYGTSSGSVCESCYDNYRTCSSCEETYYQDDVYYCEHCEEDYCESCDSEHSCRNEFREIDDPEFLDSGDEKHPSISVSRYVGTEIEVENGEQEGLTDDLKECVAIVPDGSISGVEINTPPAKDKALVDIVTHACEVLRNHGYKGTRSCGVHIHIDARDIQNDHQKIVQLVKTYYSIEDLLYSMLPPSRWQSTFCKRLAQDYLLKNFKQRASKENLELEWYKEKNADNLRSHKSHKYDGTRYYGLNIHSVFYRGTLELRYHSGTTSPRKILAWIDLNLRLFDWAVNHYNEKTVQEFFDLETGAEKLHKLNQLLNLPYDLKNYIEERVSKFNPNFRIKFNKGKDKRKVERLDLAKKKREIGLALGRAKQKAKKEIIAELKEYHGSQWQDYISKEDLDYKVNDRARNIVRRSLPQEYQKLAIDGGFIKDEELREYVELIEQGIRIGSSGEEEL